MVSYFLKLIVKGYLWLTDLLYGPFAWAYEFVAWLVSFGLWAKWRKDTLGYLVPGKALEIGFGTGALLVEMKQRGYDVCGLEPSHQMLRVTKRRFRREGISVKIVRAKADDIPFPNAYFSTILATFPSNYIFREGTLREIKRVLAVDGHVVLVGFGVVFKSGFKRWLTGWFLNRELAAFLDYFSSIAQGLGFSSDLIYHQGDIYTLPIVILEKTHDR